MFLSTQTKQVLVTGGSGFIGGSFVRKYASKYKTFFTFHRNEIRHPKAWGWRMSLDSEVQMCHLFSELRPNIVLHTAGMTSAAECEKDWQRTYDINVRGTHDLLNLCNEFGARMIFLSTDFVFDGNRGNYEEQDNIFPSTRYGRSKQMAEEIVCSSTSSPHTVLRLALVYGFGIPSAQGMVGWLRDALWPPPGDFVSRTRSAIPFTSTTCSTLSMKSSKRTSRDCSTSGAGTESAGTISGSTSPAPWATIPTASCPRRSRIIRASLPGRKT